MTAGANKALDDFKKLELAEQLIARERVISLTEARQREARNRLISTNYRQSPARSRRGSWFA